MAFSMDLRERVARPHAECGSSADVAETFGVGESWVRRLTQRLREAGTVAPGSTARAGDPGSFNSHP